MTEVKVWFSGSFANVARAQEELEASFGSQHETQVLRKFDGEDGSLMPNVFVAYFGVHISESAQVVELLVHMVGISVLFVY